MADVGSALTGVELVAAITRRRLGTSISVQNAARILRDFRHDYANEYWILQPTRDVLARAMILAETHGLRGYDAMQLGTALEDHSQRRVTGVGPATFVSADEDLNEAARFGDCP